MTTAPATRPSVRSPLRPPLLAALGLALLAAAVSAAAGEELRGRVELLAKGGKGPARGSDVRQAVVYYEPAVPQPLRPPAKPFELLTRQKEFSPRVLAIARGSRVRFPNADPILHNVFSVSPGNAFDLGIYREGAPAEKRFDNPGVVRVFCNVHHAMVAYILVLDTPFSASPAADGSFVLTGVPKGEGRLSVWHEQADPWTLEIALPQAAPVAARLEMVRPQIPPHLNKSGQSYSRNGDRYRR
ncbi:MAG: hypothetical protein M3O15_09590 [Acidobacteriota bacterium]|nr:hypothetical protein [Acidobacteriota bacterium]